MVLVKDLTELTLADLWKGVKEEDWWEGVRRDVLAVVERLLEGTMEEEIIEQLRVAKYERGGMRRGYRNGYRYRSLLTDFGLLDVVKVPRDRDGEYRPGVLVRYQRRQERVNGLVREMFLCGVSTRKVQEVLAPILGCPLSAQTVSRITRSLDGEVRRFHEQTLADHYLYLFLDGVTLKVKGVVGAKKKLVLCAYGIRTDGKRALISFRQATSESEAQWLAFLDDLRQRGLEGKALELITTDGCTGLHQALDTVYPYVKRQRCWAHKLRNVAAKLKRRHQKECWPAPRASIRRRPSEKPPPAFTSGPETGALWNRMQSTVLRRTSMNCLPSLTALGSTGARYAPPTSSSGPSGRSAAAPGR